MFSEAVWAVCCYGAQDATNPVVNPDNRAVIKAGRFRPTPMIHTGHPMTQEIDTLDLEAERIINEIGLPHYRE